MTAARVRRPEAFPSALLAYYAALFLFGTETFVISPILPQIAGDLGAPLAVTAAAAASYVIVYAVMAPLLASISDTVSRRATLVCGLTLFVIGNVLAARSHGLESFTAARAMSGLGAALAGPAIWASIVTLAPDESRNRLIGLGMAAFSLGQVAGVPIGGLLAADLGWHAVFGAISAGAALVAGAIGLMSRRNVSAPQPPSVGVHVFSLWRDERASRILLLSMAFHAANLGAYAYAGTFLAARYGLDTGQIGVMGLAVGLGSIVGALLAGRLSDAAQANGGFAGGRLPLWCGLLALSLVSTVFAPTLPLALVAIGLWFLASGAYVTDSQAIVTSVSNRSRALASAWNTTAMHAGTAIGVFGLGHLTETWFTLYACAAALSVGSLLFSLTLQADARQPVTHPDSSRHRPR